MNIKYNNITLFEMKKAFYLRHTSLDAKSLGVLNGYIKWVL